MNILNSYLYRHDLQDITIGSKGHARNIAHRVQLAAGVLPETVQREEESIAAKDLDFANLA